MINIDKWKFKFLLMKILFKASTFFSELLLHFLENILLTCSSMFIEGDFPKPLVKF